MPDPITSNKDVASKMKILETLAEIDIAAKLMEESRRESKDEMQDEGEKQQGIIDKLYSLIYCQLKPLSRESDQWEVIKRYVENSTSNLKLDDVFVIEKGNEDKAYKQFESLHNKQLLCHVSPVSNCVSILHKALRIAPPEAPKTGAMFGRGIYFADLCKKSLNYCRIANGETGCMFLAQVALGDSLKRTT